jgi:anti-sigma regulatory factor (Ser/Thr protein kinase)
LEEPAALKLDLSGLAFIGPTCLAALVSAVVGANARGMLESESTYHPPKNRLVARYLDRVDFNRLLIGEHLDGKFTRHPPTGFRPIQIFTDASDIEALATSLTGAATEALALSSQHRATVLVATAEIMQNVVDHARAGGGFAIAQRATSQREFEIAVADAGIGIATSLRENARYRDKIGDDADAIELALTPGVTANPGGANRGVGLAAIQGLLARNAGTLLVRSGSGRVEDGSQKAVQRGLIELPGTVVAVRMRIGQPFELELFAELAGKALGSIFDNTQKTSPIPELQ